MVAELVIPSPVSELDLRGSAASKPSQSRKALHAGANTPTAQGSKATAPLDWAPEGTMTAAVVMHLDQLLECAAAHGPRTPTWTVQELRATHPLE
jgi:hypothetical protein